MKEKIYKFTVLFKFGDDFFASECEKVASHYCKIGKGVYPLAKIAPPKGCDSGDYEFFELAKSCSWYDHGEITTVPFLAVDKDGETLLLNEAYNGNDSCEFGITEHTEDPEIIKKIYRAY